jgi:hypothetical protein
MGKKFKTNSMSLGKKKKRKKDSRGFTTNFPATKSRRLIHTLPEVVRVVVASF